MPYSVFAFAIILAADVAVILKMKSAICIGEWRHTIPI
jgi:hypothetical protein